jgi:cell division protein FtsZ
MNTIKEFTAEDAMVIVGTVIDDAMEDRLRVTMVATGLGSGQARAQQRPPSITLVEQPAVVQRTGTDGLGMQIEQINYDNLDQPAVMRRRERGGAGAVPAFDPTDVPAFLRKQAD